LVTLVILGQQFNVYLLKKQISCLKENKSFYITVTKYTNDPKETDSTPNITASNKKVKKGYIAVSNDLYDKGWTFGKKVYIEDIGLFEIQDKMNKRYHYTLDVFTFNKREAKKFGVSMRWAYIVEQGE
jgi:3D (Asp-Asp-Asp) domain-containing protein